MEKRCGKGVGNWCGNVKWSFEVEEVFLTKKMFLKSEICKKELYSVSRMLKSVFVRSMKAELNCNVLARGLNCVQSSLNAHKRVENVITSLNRIIK